MILTILLQGCILPINDDTGQSGADGSGVGQLADAGFVLDWWWGETWEGGACVELVLTNQGADRSDWLATVGLSDDVESWIGGYGGLEVTSSAPDEVRLEPWSGALAAWGSVEGSFCAEPATEPVSLLVFATDAIGSSDTTDTSDTKTTEEPAISGAFYTADEAFGLSYQGGAEHGSTDAECLLVKIWNFSGEDANDWHAEVTFSGPPNVEYSWSLAVFDDPDDENTVHLYGIHGSEDIAAGATMDAGLCMEPMVEPQSMVMTVE